MAKGPMTGAPMRNVPAPKGAEKDVAAVVAFIGMAAISAIAMFAIVASLLDNVPFVIGVMALVGVGVVGFFGYRALDARATSEPKMYNVKPPVIDMTIKRRPQKRARGSQPRKKAS